MPTLLKCVICGIERDAEKEFHFNGQYYKGGVRKKRKDCVYCARARRRDYFQNTQKRTQINARRRRNYRTDGGARRERNRKNSLMQLYGLTIERYDEMRKEQNFACAICEIHESNAPKGRLFVDHCHGTGKVRGLLCARCNSILGFFDEDIEKIKRAIDFLKRVRSEG